MILSHNNGPGLLAEYRPPAGRDPVEPTHVNAAKQTGSGRHALHCGIHGVNEDLDMAVTESKRLKLPRIVAMTRHMVGAEGTGELKVSQHSHDLEKTHLSFVGKDFRKIV